MFPSFSILRRHFSRFRWANGNLNAAFCQQATTILCRNCLPKKHNDEGKHVKGHLRTMQIPILQINVDQTSPANATIYCDKRYPFHAEKLWGWCTFITTCEYKNHQNRPKSNISKTGTPQDEAMCTEAEHKYDRAYCSK